MIGYCVVCGAEIEVKMCCDGRDCCCMGQPVDGPPVCSNNECWDLFILEPGKYYPKRGVNNNNLYCHEEIL